MRDLLKFMNAFVDGYGFAGVASAVEVPKIEVATRDFSAAGMAAGHHRGLADPLHLQGLHRGR